MCIYIKRTRATESTSAYSVDLNPPRINTETFLFSLLFCCRLREERGDAERALALDHKPRDLSSHNGKILTTTESVHRTLCLVEAIPSL